MAVWKGTRNLLRGVVNSWEVNAKCFLLPVLRAGRTSLLVNWLAEGKRKAEIVKEEILDGLQLGRGDINSASDTQIAIQTYKLYVKQNVNRIWCVMDCCKSYGCRWKKDLLRRVVYGGWH